MGLHGRKEPVGRDHQVIETSRPEQTMSNPTHAYLPPDTTATTVLPTQVTHYLDGTDLLAKTQALRISTVDAQGWPHASLLSAGDMLALPSGRIRFVVFHSLRPRPIWR